MNDDFYPMTKWLPTDTLSKKGRKDVRIEIDADLSQWIEHLKKLGYKEGVDFKVEEENGKKCLFKRGENPFCKPASKTRSRVQELAEYRAKNQELSKNRLTG